MRKWIAKQLRRAAEVLEPQRIDVPASPVFYLIKFGADFSAESARQRAAHAAEILRRAQESN